ncbi:hypothetical protein, partial [Aquabacterium sp.]|uniref:hypothetical protein n=1 Tax=Aquabacterium sp. TaxID=1872578 RepID=UPI0025C6A94C
PGVGPARLAMRSTLASVRRNGTASIGEAMLTALEKHLNDKVRGSLVSFANGLQSRLTDLLTRIADVRIG